MSAEAPAELKTYHGNCHCGAFKFSIQVPEITTVTACNCSICHKKGYKWIFPGESFNVERGEGTLKIYEFGRKTMSHLFCPTCGTGVMGKRHGIEGKAGIGLNVRTLLDVDILSLEAKKYDGAALPPPYTPPKYTGKIPEPTMELAEPTLYTGSCHCGAVGIALRAKGPFATVPGERKPTKTSEDFQECDCSICVRSGSTLVYPSVPQVEFTGLENCSHYSFGRKFQNHDFCSTCGVFIRLDKFDIGEARFHEEHPNVPYEGHMADMPVNMKLFEGIDWENITPLKGNWSKRGEKYVCPEPSE